MHAVLIHQAMPIHKSTRTVTQNQFFYAKSFKSSYLLVSAEVMAISGGVRNGSVVGRGGAVTASASGLRSQ